MTVPAALDRALGPVRRVVRPEGRAVAPFVVGIALALPVVFVAAFLLAASRQPASYSAVQQTVSVMAGHAGTDRWIMNAALAYMAVAYGVLAVGLRALRRVPRILLGVACVAAFGIVLSPQPAAGTTLRHGVWAGLGELVITLWPLLAVTTDGGVVPRRVGRGAVLASVLLLAWLAWAVYRGPDLGLAERVVVTAQICWPAVVAVMLYRTHGRRLSSPEGRPPSPCPGRARGARGPAPRTAPRWR